MENKFEILNLFCPPKSGSALFTEKDIETMGILRGDVTDPVKIVAAQMSDVIAKKLDKQILDANTPQ